MQLSDRALALASLGLLVLCILLGFVFLRPQFDTLVAGARATRTLGPLLPTPTPRVEATQTAASMARAAQVTMTAQANGQSVIADSINPNALSNLWPVGNFTAPSGKGTRSFVDGRYRYRVEAIRPGLVYQVPVIPFQTDFTAWMRGRRISGDASALYGITFRHMSVSNNYTLLIGNENFFEVLLCYQDHQTTLIGWSETAAIHPDDWNKIAISVRDTHFTIFINDQYVGEFDDGHVDSGLVGLAFDLPVAGTQATYEFDQFELRKP
ncbi:MAG: hypothetical protein WCF84_05620 [Anaerolineae bacterium]